METFDDGAFFNLALAGEYKAAVPLEHAPISETQKQEYLDYFTKELEQLQEYLQVELSISDRQCQCLLLPLLEVINYHEQDDFDPEEVFLNVTFGDTYFGGGSPGIPSRLQVEIYFCCPTILVLCRGSVLERTDEITTIYLDSITPWPIEALEFLQEVLKPLGERNGC